jgi:hypothetical protein
MSTTHLLSVSADAKTVKGESQGYLTGILYLAPHKVAGGPSLCPFSSPGCRAVCLYTAGKGALSSVQQARIRKARFFHANIKAFTAQICEDIEALRVEAAKRDLKPAVRLNGTSDVRWEGYGIMQRFPEVQFYDYTKYPASHRTKVPANYHLTYSLSEKPDSLAQAEAWQALGVNTAVVFESELPETFAGRPVIDGDKHDLRFTDPKGCVVGLRAKGKARKAQTAFVHQ